MKRTAAIFFFLLCAAHAQARTLYVSLTGSHDTNAPAFSTWATAATNIQAAIDAASAGDTVRVAPGTYTAQVTINKNDLTVQGGRGTLWDADRTIIDRQGAVDSVGVAFSVVTNSVLRGFTVVGARPHNGVGAIYFDASARGCLIDSCVVRSNQSEVEFTSGIRNLGNSCGVRNSIVVGNGMDYGGVSSSSYLGSDGILTLHNCIVEANSNYQTYLQDCNGRITVNNSICGNAYCTTYGGGNVTNSTTNSVMRLLGIAPASEGVGTNLVWRGVSAYIPRLGSLARKNGVSYAGIATASDGAGGPALVTSRPFLVHDATTNLNHGTLIGGVTASTNSPFAGGGSANFTNNSSDYIFLGNGLDIRTNDITVEAWINPASTNAAMGVLGKSLNGSASGRWALYVASIYKIRFLVQYGGTVVSLDSTSAVATGAWTHAAVVWRRGSGITMYVNGVSNSFASAADSTDLIYNYPVSIGRYDKANPFNGRVSDCRVWNVARTPAEIQANYTNRLTGTEPGLVGYWPLKDSLINPTDTGPFNLDNPIIHPSYHEAF